MTEPLAPGVKIAPEKCETMAEVRAGVDTLDLQLVSLIALRFRFMTAAARIKQERGAVRDEARKAQVIANVTAAADRAGVPTQVVQDIWEALVEGSIAFEFDRWDERRA